MPAWTVSRSDTAAELQAGAARSAFAAWAQAAAAALAQLEDPDRLLAGCRITVGSAQALILAGRTATGDLDLPATRTAVEHLILAAASGQILDGLLRAP